MSTCMHVYVFVDVPISLWMDVVYVCSCVLCVLCMYVCAFVCMDGCGMYHVFVYVCICL